MEALAQLAVVVAIAYAIAAVAPIVGRFLPRSIGRPLGWVLLPVILATPLFIPAEWIKLRALAMYLVNEVALKVVDSFRRDRPLTLRQYFWFLVPFPTLAVVFPNHKRRLVRPDDPWPHLIRLIVGAAGVGAGFMLALSTRRVAVLQSSFALDHLCKLVFFLLTVESLSRALFALERLAGFATKPFVENVFLSRTPAEFWRRYNYRVHDWLFQNVFLPIGGRRAPTRGVVAVFVFSAALHETGFAIATSRVEGLQALFFLLQIPAVFASGPLERLACRGMVGRLAAHAVTIAYLAATSVLFFTSLSRIFPFVYAGGPPW